ncbi:SURP and G-patch domain-containing protein 1-like protein isoform X2 [Juglans microcarpa x Juglans regia]|nr:SURP and G-patch domain-containing protein 1-like protein isoform X2 [Juglans microcarpa x Juglans regia]
MDKAVPPSLFANDGSFMERFKQLQQVKENEKENSAKLEVSRPIKIKSGSLTANPSVNKTSTEFKTNDTRKNPQSASGGKLAFSLKKKSKIVVPPVKLGADEDEDEIDAGKVSADAPMKRQKLDQVDASEHSSREGDVGNNCLYNFSFIWLGFCGQSADLLVFGSSEEQIRKRFPLLSAIFYSLYCFCCSRYVHVFKNMSC